MSFFYVVLLKQFMNRFLPFLGKTIDDYRSLIEMKGTKCHKTLTLCSISQITNLVEKEMCRWKITIISEFSCIWWLNSLPTFIFYVFYVEFVWFLKRGRHPCFVNELDIALFLERGRYLEAYIWHSTFSI